MLSLINTITKELAADDPAAADGHKASIDQATAFETLSSRRRRYVLHYLLREDRPVTLKELSTQIAAWENDTVCGAVTYKERMRAYTALRQSHLPMMADRNLVTFDEKRGVIEITNEASALEAYLDTVPHNTIPWGRYYAGLGVFSFGFVFANWMGMFPFNLVTDLWCSTIIAFLFAGSALVNIIHDRKIHPDRIDLLTD